MSFSGHSPRFFHFSFSFHHFLSIQFVMTCQKSIQHHINILISFEVNTSRHIFAVWCRCEESFNENCYSKQNNSLSTLLLCPRWHIFITSSFSTNYFLLILIMSLIFSLYADVCTSLNVYVEDVTLILKVKLFKRILRNLKSGVPINQSTRKQFRLSFI